MLRMTTGPESVPSRLGVLVPGSVSGRLRPYSEAHKLRLMERQFLKGSGLARDVQRIAGIRANKLDTKARSLKDNFARNDFHSWTAQERGNEPVRGRS